MKVIHCADLHLDSRMTAHLDPDKAKERKNELLMTFSRMVKYAEDNGVTTILIAGDLFDTKAVSVHASRTVYDNIKSHPEITFYYLRGNHDDAKFFSNIGDIPINLKMFSNNWKTYKLLETSHGSITVTGVELNSENSCSIYDSLLLNPHDFNIVTLHGQIENAMKKDQAQIINLAQLRNKNINYLALGHIHIYKEGVLPPTGVYCYSGCLEGRGFDEYGDHGFVLLDIDEVDFSMKHQFIPFASRKLYELSYDVSGCNSTAQIINQIERDLDQHDYSRDLGKIVLTGNVSPEVEKDVALVQKAFEDRFYFLRTADQTKIRIDYKEFEHDTSLKGEFVRLLENDTELTEEEKAEIIRCGLQTLNGEKIEL